METTCFWEKLNKVEGNIYVVEEEVQLTDGMYEAELKHDNVNEATIAVYTGPKLTGSRITDYVLSTPSLTPWKRIIRIYAEAAALYISYETNGDMVEAEDVNRLQDAVIITQEAVNQESARAKGEEAQLSTVILAEQSRAKAVEKELEEKISVETGRAAAAEQTLSQAVNNEALRAVERENDLADALSEEAARAAAEEKVLSRTLETEIARAQDAESHLEKKIEEEMLRAGQAEALLTGELTAEASRAQAAEEALRKDIADHKPIWDDKYSRNEIDNKFAALETAIDWKEAVETFSDLLTAYPIPEDGWTVNVKDTDYTYRYNGAEWVAISANAIPKATGEMDGLLSKEDKALYDNVAAKAHAHTNKSILDKITQALVDAWNSASSHIGNKSNPHGVTKSQIGLGNVENKTASAIRSELTKEEVVSALGFTPTDAAYNYTHPNSGVLSGTYRSITVNAQGHVTGGSNPTTLSGYGITDAAAKAHNHDNVYVKKGTTWNGLMGV